MTGRSFDVLIPYSPAGTGVYWWERPGLDVRPEFDAARQGGIDHLAIDLLWSDFQPDRTRVAVQPMRQLEQVLDLAWDRGIRIRLTFFPVRIGPLLWLPSWALVPGSSGRSRVVSGHHTHSMHAYNLFTDGAMTDAEDRLVREIISAFSDHPAVSGWMLGRGLSSASGPGNPGAFAAWVGSLADTARRAGAKQPLWYSFSAVDLVCRGDMAPEHAAAAGVGVDVVDDWKPAWATGPPSVWSGYLAALGQAVAGAAVAVSGIGGCTLRFGSDPARCREEADVAESIAARIEAVRASGGAGAGGLSLMDYSDDLRGAPPYREDPDLLTSGLLTSQALPKSTLSPWITWSGNRESVRLALDLPLLDPEERHGNAEAVAREFYEAYTR